VQQIKKKIKKQTGVPVFQQVLILAGRKVENNERVVQLLSNAKELTMFLVINKEASNSSSPSMSKEIPSIESSESVESASGNNSVSGIEITPEFLIAGRDAPVLKLSFEDQHRRIPFEGHSFNELTSLCTYFFGVKNTRRMLLQYKDEDGDLVQISTDTELAYALQYCATNTNPRVLRLQFSLRQCKNKISSPEDNQPLSVRTLQEGDIIQLSNGGLNLVLSENVVSARSDDSEASHWIVEKPLPPASQKQEEAIIFLKNKTKDGASHLRSSMAGDGVDHDGGTGPWARLCVEYVSDCSRSIRLRSSCKKNEFLGIVHPAGANVSPVVRSNLNKDDKGALFNVRLIK